MKSKSLVSTILLRLGNIFEIFALLSIVATVLAFFASYTYSNIIQDTTLRATIFDSVSQNKIVGRRFTYNLLKPVRTIESTTITLSPSGFYAGAFTSASREKFGFGPEVSYLNKNKNIHFGFDIPNRMIHAGITLRIHARGNR